MVHFSCIIIETLADGAAIIFVQSKPRAQTKTYLDFFFGSPIDIWMGFPYHLLISYCLDTWASRRVTPWSNGKACGKLNALQTL